MIGRAAPGRQRPVHRRPHQRVQELQRPPGREDAGLDERVDGGQHRLGRQSGECAGVPRLGAAEDGDGLGQRDCAGRQTRQAQEHAAGDGHRPDVPHLPGRLRRRLDPVRGERPEQFGSQERIAARHLVTGTHESIVGPAPEDARRQGADRWLAERPQLGARHGTVGPQGRQQTGPGAALGQAHRAEDRDRQAVQPPREIDQEALRRPVRPMQVVDHQRQRPLLGEVRQQPVQTVLDSGSLRRLPTGRRRSDRRERQPGGAAQQSCASLVVASEQLALQQLAHESIRDLVLELAAAAAEHP
jgi:hypothetical protein